MEDMLIRWVGPLIGTLALGAAGWAHGKISTQGETISAHEAKIQDEIGARQKATENLRDELAQEHADTKEALHHIEAQLDRIQQGLIK